MCVVSEDLSMPLGVRIATCAHTLVSFLATSKGHKFIFDQFYGFPATYALGVDEIKNARSVVTGKNFLLLMQSNVAISTRQYRISNLTGIEKKIKVYLRNLGKK